MKNVFQINDTTPQHLSTVATQDSLKAKGSTKKSHKQQDTTHLQLHTDSLKNDTTQDSINRPNHTSTAHFLYHFHQNDSINVDSLANIFYQGYLHKDTIYHLSDLKIKQTTIKPKQITKRTITYIGNQRNETYPSWFIFVFIIATLTIGLTKFLQGSKIKFLFQSLLKSKIITQYMDERNSIISVSDILLWLCYLLCLSTLFYTVFFYFNLESDIPFSKINLLLTLFISITLYHGGKFFILLLAGEIFKISTFVKEYILQWSFLHQTTGIIILPFTALIIYYESSTALLIYSTITITLLTYTFSLMRGIKISRKHNISIFYIFLYICTLEILPLIVLFKLLIVN